MADIVWAAWIFVALFLVVAVLLQLRLKYQPSLALWASATWVVWLFVAGCIGLGTCAYWLMSAGR